MCMCKTLHIHVQKQSPYVRYDQHPSWMCVIPHVGGRQLLFYNDAEAYVHRALPGFIGFADG